MESPCNYMSGPHGRIAYRQLRGDASVNQPGIIWLGGFRSDMLGTKAAYLATWAGSTGRSYLRFDYSGHGESEGHFEDGCISAWAADAFAAIETLTAGPQILVGSSMGAWIATLAATRYQARITRSNITGPQIAGVIFIAPAPDFTERLMWPAFTEAERNSIMRDGRLEQPSDYSDEPEIITRKLIEDGRKNLVMPDLKVNDPIAITAPVRIFQGMRDDVVPWQHALAFAESLETEDIEIFLTKAGDHRLSTPNDLNRLVAALEDLAG